MRERRKIVLFVHIDDSGCINVEIDKVCATDDDRSEQETIVHKVTRSETTYSEPVLEPECACCIHTMITSQYIQARRLLSLR